MEIRKIKQEDFGQYTILRKMSLEDYQKLTAEKLKLSYKQIKNEFESIISDKKRVLLAIEEANEIKAYLMGRLIKNAYHCTGYIDDIFVRKDTRRRGFGGLLVQEFEHWLITRRATKISLGVRKNNTKAIQLYEQAGFTITHYEMGKNLN